MDEAASGTDRSKRMSTLADGVRGAVARGTAAPRRRGHGAGAGAVPRGSYPQTFRMIPRRWKNVRIASQSRTKLTAKASDALTGESHEA